LSQDVWALAVMDAQHRAKELGLDATQIENALTWLLERTEVSRRRHPLASMF
jgi:hypothetical protein